jgi:hypothetical protein
MGLDMHIEVIVAYSPAPREVCEIALRLLPGATRGFAGKMQEVLT